MLKVKLLTNTAKLPYKKYKTDAGYDLYADEGQILLPNSCKLIKIGISISIPEGTYGRIAPRSGFSYKFGTMIGAGVIDKEYRGEIKVLVFNIGDKMIEINKGDRIAQLILEKISYADIVQVDDLDNTNRGDKGFGSTGSK